MATCGQVAFSWETRALMLARARTCGRWNAMHSQCLPTTSRSPTMCLRRHLVEVLALLREWARASGLTLRGDEPIFIPTLGAHDAYEAELATTRHTQGVAELPGGGRSNLPRVRGWARGQAGQWETTMAKIEKGIAGILFPPSVIALVMMTNSHSPSVGDHRHC